MAILQATKAMTVAPNKLAVHQAPKSVLPAQAGKAGGKMLYRADNM